MKLKYLWISLLAVLLGLFIVVVSVASSVGEFLPVEKVDATQRQLYFSHTILPDHMAYPLLMVADRIQLEIAPSKKKLWFQVEYGWRRLDYARKLLEKDKSDLALSVFTKSQKYFLNATQTAIEEQADDEVKLTLLKHVVLYIGDAKAVAENFTGAQKAVTDRLIMECESTKLRLSQSLSS